MQAILLVGLLLASPDHVLVTTALHCSNRNDSAPQAWRVAEMHDMQYFLVDQQGGQRRPCIAGRSCKESAFCRSGICIPLWQCFASTSQEWDD